MHNKERSLALEHFRYVVFMGLEPSLLEADTHLTQEQYISMYEQQWERDPAKEKRLIIQFSAPILPFYKKHQEQITKMEQMISGETTIQPVADEQTLEDFYDDVVNLETEIEWQEFKTHLLQVQL